jgi:hypothetical protein
MHVAIVVVVVETIIMMIILGVIVLHVEICLAALRRHDGEVAIVVVVRTQCRR